MSSTVNLFDCSAATQAHPGRAVSRRTSRTNWGWRSEPIPAWYTSTRPAEWGPMATGASSRRRPGPSAETNVAFFEDLGSIDYFGELPAQVLVPVGWLALGEDVPQGEVEPSDFGVLCSHLADPWQPRVYAGKHDCEFCRFTGGPSRMQYQGATFGVGSSNLFLPSEGGVLVAPSMIAHYIDAHHYCPPERFWAAVRGCPDQRSIEYKKAILEAGGGALLRTGR